MRKKRKTIKGAKRVKKAFNAVAICSPADRFFVSVWHLKKEKKKQKMGDLYILYIHKYGFWINICHFSHLPSSIK